MQLMAHRRDEITMLHVLEVQEALVVMPVEVAEAKAVAVDIRIMAEEAQDAAVVMAAVAVDFKITAVEADHEAAVAVDTDLHHVQIFRPLQ